MSDLAVDQQIGAFLAVCRTASLATTDVKCRPHAANVQFALAGPYELCWASSPDAQHSRDLAGRGEAAVSIYAHDDRPENIHGLQLTGRVDPAVGPADPEWDRLLAIYMDRFEFLRGNIRWQELLRRQRLYLFRPSWLRWIDNRRGFGWKLERELDADPSA